MYNAHYDFANIKVSDVLVSFAMFLIFRILIGQQLLSPWSVGICTRPRHHRKQTLANFRVVATLVYEIIMTLDPDLPPVAHAREALTRSTSLVDQSYTGESWMSSIMSWLMRSGADDADAGLDEVLLNDHPVFETMRDIQRFLFVSNNFSGVRASLDTWMSPLATSLGEWVEAVVRHVIESKYATPIERGGQRPSPRVIKVSPREENSSPWNTGVIGPDNV